MRRLHVLTALIAAVAVSAIATAEDRVTSRAGDIVLRPLAHASVQIEFGGRSIYIDPWSAANLTSLPTSNLIIVTDTDDGAHHLDVKALQALRSAGGTVVIPASGTKKVPDGVVMGNGATQTFRDVTVEAIAAYDLTPGDPYHPKGEANGYVLTMGGTRIYFAGVTECVPEMKALRDIDIAFMPMNLPNGRMVPDAVAACVRSFKPKVVYPYHYDQGYAARLAGRGDPAGGAKAAATIQVLADALKGVAEVRSGNWYPTR